MSTRNVIVLEFNELSPILMDRFIAAGHLPNFKALRERSLTAVTDAGEKPPLLEPWVQWVTVHTGAPYAEHQAYDLHDGPKVKAPRIWDVLSRRGKSSWICGSMNTGYQPGLKGALLPDPWATDTTPYPPQTFEAYFKFVSTYVQEYASGRTPLSPQDYLKFGAFMASHGLSSKTVIDALSQLASERGANTKWRRAAILDRLQWDLFRALYGRMKPTLATYFINSTAHFQHFHWRNMEPELFEIAPDAEEQAAYADAILFGYRKMDVIVGEAMALAGPQTALVFCTALSQQALTGYDADGGKQVFKPHDALALCRFAGVTSQPKYEPVMSEEFHLKFATAAEADAAAQKLRALRLADGTPVMRADPVQDGIALLVACALHKTPPADTQIVSRESNGALAFHTVFFPVGGLKSGYHHPDGMLWISSPDLQPGHIERKVALEEIAPTLLALVGEAPSEAFARPALAEISRVESVIAAE